MISTLAPQPVAAVQIGPHRVGAAGQALVVAEAGVNHDGSCERALQLVDVAAEAGADFVKFQVFRAAELTTAAAPRAAYQQKNGNGSQRDMLAQLELSDADLARIRDHCDARGIGFLATPFGPRDVDRLVDLGVCALKIASTDIDNPLLLRRAAATGLPLIVSTGTATQVEIAEAVGWLSAAEARERLVLLHCISGYPAPVQGANLGAIRRLREIFGVPTGFSDHTVSKKIAGWAVAAGAAVLEKHFTLDRDAPGPDHAMSLDPAQLAAYVAAARSATAALGDGCLGCAAVEAEVRNVARKSIVAAGPIRAGDVLSADNVTVKRPGGGLAPRELDALLGRRAARDLAPDTPLAWEDLA
jgi:N,N'-diacetyllegionaminate synthase